MKRLFNFGVLVLGMAYLLAWLAAFVVGPMFLVYQLLRLCKEVL